MKLDQRQPGSHGAPAVASVKIAVGSGPLNRIRQLSALALDLLRYDPGVCVEAVNWVRIDGDPAAPVQIDGEVLGALPLEIRLHPERLNLIFPLA